VPISIYYISLKFFSISISFNSNFFCKTHKMPTDSESATLLARARLATLTAHFLPFNNEPADHLLPHRLSAQLPVANFNGTLTIVDERTGKKYQVEVSQDGTVKATDFKKVA
jgi:citrate synthase